MIEPSEERAHRALLAEAQEWRRHAKASTELEQQIESLREQRNLLQSQLDASVQSASSARAEVVALDKARATDRSAAANLAASTSAERERLESKIDELRHSNATLAQQRDKFRNRLQAQYDMKWSRIGGVIRSTSTRPTSILSLPIRLAREARRSPRSSSRPSDSSSVQPVDREPPRAEESTAVATARGLRKAGDHEGALAALDSALLRRPRRPDLLHERRATLVAMGELSEALAANRRLVRVERSDKNLAAEQQLVGRLRDLDPSWYPDIGPAEHLTPASSSGVLHLLKESLPYHERGYTMRSRYALLSQLEAGFRPTVMTSLGFPRLDGTKQFDSVEIVDGIEHHRLDLGPDYPYRRIPFDDAVANQAWLAADVVRRVRPAVIHANSGYRGYDTAVTALALGRRFGIPVVYDVRSFLESTWTSDIDRSEAGEHYRLRLLRENQCMHDAQLVFTIAHTMRDEIVNRGIDPDKIVVIPNAVDPSKFVPVDTDIELARSLGLAGKTVLGYISNIGHREGIDVLIRAMAILRDRRDDAACLVVGGGPELDRLRELTTELGLQDRVVLTGPVPHDEIARYYSLIDLFVIPRRDDHAARLVTPLKPFEAMSMGLPLLVADLPALSEVAAPGERGLSFTPEDPHDLADVAEQLLDDPQRRHQLGVAGRDWVLSERTWSSNAKRYVEAYGRLGVHPGTDT